jgi:hypothetical protein
MEQQATVAGREQRRSWRYACNGNVTLYNLIAQRWIPGTILDLSISGCLVRPDEPGALRAGDVVEVSFSLHGFSVRVTGAIRNVRPDNSMGVEFRGRNDQASQQINRLMQKLADEWTRAQHPENHA